MNVVFIHHFITFQVFEKITISVGHWISKVNSIIIVFELISESKSVKVFVSIFGVLFQVILKVGYIRASSVPLSFILLIFLLRKAKYFHSIVVKRITFCKIETIKFDRFVCSSVLNSKEKPLSVTVSVDVILKDEVVFWIRNF